MNVEPFAGQWDRSRGSRLRDRALARCGYLGCSLPREYGGQGWDIVTFGLLNEAFGRGSSALTGVLTVQAMVSMALLKWGTRGAKAQLAASARQRGDDRRLCADGARRRKRPRIAGHRIHRSPTSDVSILNGRKKWISCAQFADRVSGVREARAAPGGVPGAAGHSRAAASSPFTI